MGGVGCRSGEIVPDRKPVSNAYDGGQFEPVRAKTASLKEAVEYGLWDHQSDLIFDLNDQL